MTQLSLKNEEAQFSALQKASQKIADTCDLLTVTDPITLAIAKQNLSLAKEKLDAIEHIRKTFKQPYWDAGVAIDNLAKPLKAPLEKALEAGKKKILDYEHEQQRKAQAEIDRINAFKEKINKYSETAIKSMDASESLEHLEVMYLSYVKNFPEAEEWAEFNEEAKAMRANLRLYASQRKIQIESPDQADDDTGDLIKEAIQEEVEAVGEEQIALIDTTPAKGIRSAWKHELKDIRAVAHEYLMLDDRKVREFIKHNDMDVIMKDGEVVGGIRFYIEQSVTIR